MLQIVKRICYRNKLKVFIWPEATVTWYKACVCVQITAIDGKTMTYFTTHGYKREPTTTEEKKHNQYIELRIIQNIISDFDILTKFI